MKRTSIIVTLLSIFLAIGAQAQTTLRMASEQTLTKGNKIEVAGKGYLTLQADGNFVAYNASNQAKWASGTNGRIVSHITMQADGNLVIYNGAYSIWSCGTANIGANGGYFEANPDTWQVAVFKSSGEVARVLQPGNGAAIGNYTITGFCEAGYTTRFKLYYNNGSQVALVSPDLTVGMTHKFSLPMNAFAAVIKAYRMESVPNGIGMYSGSTIQEVLIFEQNIGNPGRDLCFKTYGTVFGPAWNQDCPGGAPAAAQNQIKFTHGAGFVANWQITYNQPGKPATNINPTGTSLGWKNTYTIPADATNIRILIQGATGLVWEPWRTTYDKTFPTPPSGLCIKIYGTTLDQKWNNDCY